MKQRVDRMKRYLGLAVILLLLLSLCCCMTRQDTVPESGGTPEPAQRTETEEETDPEASSGDLSPAGEESTGESGPDTGTEEESGPAESEPSEDGPEEEETGGGSETIDGGSWKLILVNAGHPLPEDFTVKLKALRNGHFVDERIYPELQQMFDDARAEGIYPLINESYRTAERQQEILDKYIAQYEKNGMSRAEAEAKARTVVALPGTSEHQLGLALDIIAEKDADSTATWQWLKENAWRYGFILRYPEDKEEITGISFEPWHYRYVGKEAAQEITSSGICLEEYLSANE